MGRGYSSRIAEWADTTIDDIQALNPELRRWTTPVRDSKYDLKVPVGTAGRISEQLEHASAGDMASLKFYTVKRGDTLPLIARRLQVSKIDLAEANYLPTTARVSPGQRLMVPHEATVLMAARTDRRVPVAEARAISTQPTLMAQGPAGPTRVKVVYRVQRGDTLVSIAQFFRTSVSALRTWNRSVGSRLIPGERLMVYTTRRTN